MGTVTIDATDFDVYGDVAGATSYFLGTTQYGTWSALDADTQGRLIIMATRFLDRQRWQGSKTSEAQALEFPRTGLTDKNGVAVDDATVPVAVEQATYELALTFNTSTAIMNAISSGSNVKRVKAGSVEVENFRPTDFSRGRFPKLVQELVGLWLGGSGSTAAGFAFGQGERRYYQPDAISDEDQVDQSDYGLQSASGVDGTS